MGAGPDAIPQECYQCGFPTLPLVFTDDTTKSGWFSCDNCGEHIISVSDVAALARDDQERAIRDKLGVEEFLNSRRINNRVADE
ncbi:hypothetical protein LZK98_11425 [Sphingomonas cannabina]|uniref:hypothetical protein n=1 Tax=Sphingomonas cannabina TaxID=2899123 RepID=UPI001F2C574D|nr:hypothetical protein [Sphingomonas cannabina]UIJ43700.1 hypothetical protein LZK98_11425 [Sphingomonas cannabina]